MNGSTRQTDTESLERLTTVIQSARQVGADAADAVLIESQSLSQAQRLGKTESLERSESLDLGLRVFVGRRQAVVSSSDLSREGLAELVTRAVSMARNVPEDPFCGLAPEALLATDIPELDIYDASEPTPETLINWAAAAEDAARAVVGVTNSEGAEAGWGRSGVTLVTSTGFAQAYATSHVSISASVIAGEGTAMERDYDYTASVFVDNLLDPADVGRNAGEKAVRRLNPRRARSAQVPVIYDPRVSGGLLGHLSSAINGAAVARGTSFLKDKMGQRLFPESVTIVDDALRKRGLRSKPFDAEGVATRRREIVSGGILTGWILDMRSARQLELKTTGNAARSTASPPSPSSTNLYMEAGAISPEELISSVDDGFYVNELIGFGVNGVTGDYSRGAAGFWIEKGEIAYPVSELTIAGNLNDMFAHMTAANDLVLRYGTDAPTIRIDGMTIAGQ
jgi:PmbA protein